MTDKYIIFVLQNIPRLISLSPLIQQLQDKQTVMKKGGEKEIRQQSDAVLMLRRGHPAKMLI